MKIDDCGLNGELQSRRFEWCIYEARGCLVEGGCEAGQLDVAGSGACSEPGAHNLLYWESELDQYSARRPD